MNQLIKYCMQKLSNVSQVVPGCYHLHPCITSLPTWLWYYSSSFLTITLLTCLFLIILLSPSHVNIKFKCPNHYPLCMKYATSNYFFYISTKNIYIINIKSNLNIQDAIMNQINHWCIWNFQIISAPGQSRVELHLRFGTCSRLRVFLDRVNTSSIILGQSRFRVWGQNSQV